MSKVGDLHKKWSRDSDYRKAFDELKPEFDLARSLIEARLGAGLTQAQLAKRMKTSQSVVARLEGGSIHPSTERWGRSHGPPVPNSGSALSPPETQPDFGNYLTPPGR